MKPWNCAATFWLLLAAPLQLAAQADDSRWSAPSASSPPSAGEAGEFVPAAVERGDLTTYTGLTEFLDAVGDLDLTVEDFEGGFAGAGVVKVCYEALGHASDDPCYVPGDLEPGFAMRASRGEVNFVGLVSLGPGVIGNADVVVGANVLDPPENATRIDFEPPATAVAMDVYDGQQAQPVTVTAFNAADEAIGGFSVDPPGVSQPAFAGFTSPQPVAYVEVNSTVPGGGELVDNLRFGGGAGRLVVTPEQAAFGYRPLDVQADLEITLSNAGALDANVGNLDPPAAPFGIIDDGCSGTTLAGGESCSLTLTFAPPHAGSFREDLDTGAASGPVPATGRGATARAIASPRSLDFGQVAPGDTSPPQSVQVANRHPVPVTIQSLEAPGGIFVHGGGDCPAMPFELQPGETCTLEFQFTPDASGPHAAVAALATSGDPGRLRVHLSGEGTGRQIASTVSREFSE